MIKQKLFFAFFSLIFFNSVAQEKISVSQTTAEINETNGNALRVEINRAKMKTIAKEWKSLMKDYDADVDINKSEIISTEAKISSISSMGISVFAKIKELSESRNEFLVIFFNGDRPISSGSDVSAYTAAKSILEDFALKLSNEATNDYKEAQIKLLKNYEDDLKDLEKAQERAKEDIEDAKKTIEEKETEIKENKKNQVEMLKKIETQKEQVKNAKREAELFE